MADTDFDARAASLVRRRKMAEMLQAQSLKGFEGPKQGLAKTSIFEPLAQMAQAWAGTHMANKADEADAANEAARTAEINRLIENRPMGTPAQAAIPATPEIPAGPGETRPPSPMLGETPKLQDIFQGAPTPGLNELGPQPLPKLLPGTPAIPGKPEVPAVPAKPPTSQEMLPWVMNLARTGGAGKDLAKAFEPRIAENMFPKALTPEQIADMEGRRLEATARREDAQQRHLDNLDLKERQLREDARQANMTDETRRMIADQTAEIKRQRNAASGGEGSGKEAKYDLTPDVSLTTGRNLVKDKAKGTYHERRSDGSIDPNPYGGETTTKTEYSKQIKEMSRAAGGVAMLNQMAEDVAGNAQAFTTQAKWDTNPVANFFGKGRDLSGMTPEQATFRSSVFNLTANLKHSMYGATLTPAESADAAKWVITDNDDFTQVQSKLRGRAAFESEKLRNMTSGDKAQLRARGVKFPDDAPAATPAAAPIATAPAPAGKKGAAAPAAPRAPVSLEDALSQYGGKK